MKRAREFTCILGLALGLGLLVHCTKKESPPAPEASPPEPIAQEVTAVNQSGEVPDIEFQEMVHDFGKIDQGEKIEHVFKFKNVGKSELVIEKVKSS